MWRRRRCTPIYPRQRRILTVAQGVALGWNGAAPLGLMVLMDIQTQGNALGIGGTTQTKAPTGRP
jgi:hypothetical protein